jgi:hypothetical protein
VAFMRSNPATFAQKPLIHCFSRASPRWRRMPQNSTATPERSAIALRHTVKNDVIYMLAVRSTRERARARLRHGASSAIVRGRSSASSIFEELGSLRVCSSWSRPRGADATGCFFIVPSFARAEMLRDAVLRNAALQNSRPRVVQQEAPSTYLDTHHVPFYLNDVTTLLLRIRPAAPLDFIASYFSEVLNGTHVLLREFAYVSACPHNRWSFVRVVQESFAGVSPAHHELSAVDLLRQRGQTRPLAVPEVRLLSNFRAHLAALGGETEPSAAQPLPWVQPAQASQRQSRRCHCLWPPGFSCCGSSAQTSRSSW